MFSQCGSQPFGARNADYLRLSRVTARLWRLLQIVWFCARSCRRSCGECPDGGALDVVAFQHALAGNVIAGQWRQPVARQIVPAEVAHQDSGSAGVASFGEPHHLTGQIPFVERVGNQHQIGAAGGEIMLVRRQGNYGLETRSQPRSSTPVLRLPG